MVCVGLSEKDLLQWHDVTRKILGEPGKILVGQWPPWHPLAPPLLVITLQFSVASASLPQFVAFAAEVPAVNTFMSVEPNERSLTVFGLF